MKGVVSVVVIGFLTLCFLKSLGETRDSSIVKARVRKIIYSDYYVVIKATKIGDNKELTILSIRNERNKTVSACRDSIEIKKGKIYEFSIEPTNRIKNGTNNYMIINLRRFYYGKLLLLEAGELPYIALNMFNNKLFYHCSIK